MYIDDDGVLYSLGESQRRGNSDAMQVWLEAGAAIERETDRDQWARPGWDGHYYLWQYGFVYCRRSKWAEWRRYHEVDEV